MFTAVLIFVSAVAGIAMIAAGVWGWSRLRQISTTRGITMPLRYYALVGGIIGIGIGLLGMAQALRLLLVIFWRV